MSRRVDFSADLILVCNSLDAGGIQRVVATLANEWSRRGRKVCVITLHDRRRFYQLDTSIRHIVVDRAGMTRLSEFVKALASRINLSRLLGLLPFRLVPPSIFRLFSKLIFIANLKMFLTCQAVMLRRALGRVESPVVVSLGTPVNVITLKACRRLGRRVIISERGDAERLAGLVGLGRLSRKLYDRADLVTANSRGALRHMCDFVAPRKLAFVPNPLVFQNGNVHAASPALPAKPFILVVARLGREKAHDVLLAALALLGDELGGWRLAVVGDGRLRDALRAQAERLGVAERVDWYGVVQDPQAFYRAASIFVLPSRNEGMPNALLEAMGSGLPVIVSDGSPGPLELVEDGVTGLVVPVNDARALTDALVRLANDETLRSRLGEAARERVSEYDLPRALAAWESVIGLSR